MKRNFKLFAMPPKRPIDPPKPPPIIVPGGIIGPGIENPDEGIYGGEGDEGNEGGEE